MVLKLFLRSHPPLLPLTFFSPPHFFPKPRNLSLLPTATSSAVALSSTLDEHFFIHGPSLKKGKYLSPSAVQPLKADEDDAVLLNEDSFARVFDIFALRVPSEHCFILESRLRGHLLNWPRIRNIARVPGDEIDEEIQKFFSSNSSADEEDKDKDKDLVILNRRIYGKSEGDGERLSPVLYRDKLARTFNSTGFMKFRNLAKISRPKRGKKKDEGEKGVEKRHGGSRNDMAVVEVVEEEETEEGGEPGNICRLLGDEFKGTKWRVSTRLLLLDEGLTCKSMEEMPEAIKAVLREYAADNRVTTFELVKCRLTLFYSYWLMNEVLEALLPKDIVTPSAFETVGHIAHLNLRDEHLPYKKVIAKVVLDKNKPKIQTVVNKIDGIQNDYRTMQLDILAGNHSLVTSVVENGLRFHVDLATVYWNSRLGTERQRLLNCFKKDDVVCDVFSGVGPIAVSAAKKVKRVYANDLNPDAVEYLERNCVLNRLERKIEVFNMDGRRFIESMFARKNHSITQVVMNLPNAAVEFLDVFRGIFRKYPADNYSLPQIHVYGFSKAWDPEFDFHERIRIALCEVGFNVDMRKVRLVAPGKWMLCASFYLPETVAFSKYVSSE